MPTIIRQDGFRVVIYPNDHIPAHVHVIKGGGEVRIDISNEVTAPSLMSVEGKISDRDVVKALALVALPLIWGNSVFKHQSWVRSLTPNPSVSQSPSLPVSLSISLAYHQKCGRVELLSKWSEIHG